MSEYVGGGETGRLVSELARLAAIDRRGDRARVRELAGRLKAEDAAAVAIVGALGSAAAGMMEAAGFHRIKRGTWRRRRTMNTTASAASMTEARAREVGEAASKGDPVAVRELSLALRAHPGAFRATATAMANAARTRIIRQVFPEGDAFGPVVMEAHLDATARDLAGPSPSAVETLLADRVAFAWLDLWRADIDATGGHGGGDTVRMAELRIHRQDRAQRRYLLALKALAEVRRLPTVALQVNAQVNIGGKP